MTTSIGTLIITTGVAIVFAAGAGSIALRERHRPQLANRATIAMLAGAVVLCIGTWVLLDDTWNLVDWVVKIIVTAVVIALVQVGVVTLRADRRSGSTEKEQR